MNEHDREQRKSSAIRQIGKGTGIATVAIPGLMGLDSGISAVRDSLKENPNFVKSLKHHSKGIGKMMVQSVPASVMCGALGTGIGVAIAGKPKSKSQQEKTAFDTIEESFEKVAMNASKARYLAKTVGIISPENTTKSIKRSLKPFMSNGNLKSGRQIQRTKEALGSLPNNTFNKIQRVSAKKGHLAEVGAEFIDYKSKRNLNIKNTPSEGAKLLAKQYNEYADLADKKDVISKARAKIKKRKLYLTPENASHARQQAKKLLSPPNSKYNTKHGDVVVGSGSRINVGSLGYSTTHTHPGHSRISYMNAAKRDPDKTYRAESQKLVDGFSKKSENYKLVNPSPLDERGQKHTPYQQHNIIQPERSLEGVHQANKKSLYFDRRPKKERMQEVKELRQFFN